MKPDLAKLLKLLGILLIFWLVCTLRGLPSYFRGTYATEGGAWLSHIWRIGFPEAVRMIRPDYCVLGNLVVIKAADLVTTVTTGSPLGHSGPFWQHTFSCLYVALNFTLIFSILRRHHGAGRALLVTLVMLLAPDLDDENRIFGEANNLGFFSVPAVLFIYYDFWLRTELSRPRLVLWLLLIAFHSLTSPLAALVAAGMSSLLLVRAGWENYHCGGSFRQLWRRVAYHSLPIFLTIAVVLRARTQGASAAMASEAAQSGLGSLQPFLLDYLFFRQWLYPLTSNFYLSGSDRLTVQVLVVVLVGIAIWLWAERRTGRGRETRALLLLSAVALGVAFLTIYTRRWLTGNDWHYESLWPARYFLAQTMIMAGFYALVLFRCGELWPCLRRVGWICVPLLGLNYVWQQVPHIMKVLEDGDPAVTAKHWAAQLGRETDLHTLTGDLKQSVASNVRILIDVPMYIEGHAVPVPASMLEAKPGKASKKRADVIEADMAPATAVSQVPASARNLVVESLRIIPRARGLLVTGDALLSQVPDFSSKKRHLWFPQLPGQPIAKAYAYEARTQEVSDPEVAKVSHRAPREKSNWVFKFVLWWDQPPSHEALLAALRSGPLVLGESVEQPYAMGKLLVSNATVPFSVLRDDPTCAHLLQPPIVGWTWQGQPSELRLSNLTLGKASFMAPPITAAAFDEAAYLVLNPDVKAALDQKAIASARAHFDAFGQSEGREFALRAATIDISKSGLTSRQFAGIYIHVNELKRRPLESIRCVLRGASGEEIPMILAPPEGCIYFSTNYLPAGWMGPEFPLQELEIQLMGVVPGGDYRFHKVTLFRSPP